MPPGFVIVAVQTSASNVTVNWTAAVRFPIDELASGIDHH